MNDKTCGSIELSDGSIFNWVSGSGDKEIFGHIENPNGGIVKGTSGWYRTTVPATACKLAEQILIS